ncbi:HNH endonuclease signature motif containing protein [Actinomycetospora flava]|uniref:DUF222 domain-containing protein n=1 Tax=Actinomycetospora flava TaxID=3129232 RepID=A0ABU8M1J0_9PSEU
MSERVLGPVEREVLERARLGEITRRREGYARLEQVAELDRAQVAELSGDRCTRRLLETLWRIPATEAKRLVGEARDLCPRSSLSGEPLPPRLPATATVAAAGEVGPAHIAIIRTTMRRLDRVDSLPVHDWTAAEQTLADEATRLGPKGLQAVADRVLAHLDPDGEEPPEEDAGRDDELWFVRRRNGMLLFRGRMSDPVDAEAFVETIDTLATPCGPDDQRELKLRRIEGLKDLVNDATGPHGIATDTRRDPGETNDATDDSTTDDSTTGDSTTGDSTTGDTVADALIPAPRRPEPTGHPAGRTARAARPGRAPLTITLDQRWLTDTLTTRGRHRGYGLLDSGAPVHPATLRRWACDADIVPIVLGPKSEPLDVGRLQRTVTDAIRRALNLRDGGCAFPDCTRRPRRCHAHHIHHWRDHGPTRIDNLVLLCSYHHQLLHHGHWTVTIQDGRPWFTPPDWIDPHRQPRLGGRPRVPV